MSERMIGHELKILNNSIIRYFENNTDSDYDSEITSANAWIIGYISQHPNTDVFQRNLEKDCGTTRSTISKVVNLMEKKGLIKRQSVEGDARLKKLVLTPKAERLAEQMQKRMLRMDEKLTRGFSKEELEELAAYIRRMQENINSLD